MIYLGECFEYGMRSQTGFAPCLECAKGFYAIDSTSPCESCAPGTTRGFGSTSIDDCEGTKLKLI